MKWMILFMVLVLTIGCKPSKFLQQEIAKLSEPNVVVSNVFFEKEAIINIDPALEGVRFEYSIDGNEKKKYKQPILILESSKIMVQAIGGGYIPSSEVSVEVIKIPTVKNNSILSGRPLNEKYGHGGLDILIDVEKGQSSFQKGWLGYLGDTVDFTIAFDEREVDQVMVSTLRNHSAWIFSPHQINIYNNEKMIWSQSLPGASENENNSSVFTKVSFPKIKTNQLKVEIIAPKEIPFWHSGVGSKPWIFIDEILIY
jgi:hexosaminidase